MNLYDKKSFTLIELLIVIGILAILVAAVFIVLNPFEYLKQSRDSKRITDLASLDKALAFMEAQGATSFGDSNVIYVSIPDTSETCNNLGFDTVDGWTYHCVTPTNLTNIDGTGWIPVNFNSSGIAPISKLPIDPVNNTSTGLYYTYVAGSYELTALLESVKYQQRIAAMDGGDSPVIYERGSHIGVTPRIVGPSGYSHKRTITINNATSTLTDFQVDVPLDTATLIAANKMNSDCSDIRMTSSDGVTEIDFYVDKCNTSATHIWIEAPSLTSGDNTVYLYYGNPGASSTSNGDNTFLFFDDFLGTSLNGSKWTPTPGMTPTVSGGIVSVASGGVAGAGITGPKITRQPAVFEYKMKRRDAGGVYAYQFNETIAGSWSVIFNYEDSGMGISSRGNVLGNKDSVSGSPTTEWREYRTIVNGKSASSARGTDIYGTLTDAVSITCDNEPVGYDYTVAFGRWYTPAFDVDWVRVRKYVAETPFVTVGSETAI